MENDVFIDAGLFIGALLMDDPRHAEAREIVEMSRHGKLHASTTAGMLCDVYAALTWEHAQPQHSPEVAVSTVMAIVQSPSQIQILPETPEILPKMMELARKHKLKARGIHDARHASTALIHNIRKVITYDTKDWKRFNSDGIHAIEPRSILANNT
jgi:predicted nucleic acid-binding protein